MSHRGTWIDRRRTGRTQRMLQRALEAVKRGERVVVVVGADYFQCETQLRPRLLRMIEESGIVVTPIEKGASCLAFACGETRLQFESAKVDIDRKLAGARPLMFWDHWARGIE